MKRSLAAACGLIIVLAVPASLSAKGETSKITLTGGDLTRPIEITNSRAIARGREGNWFRATAGAGGRHLARPLWPCAIIWIA